MAAQRFDTAEDFLKHLFHCATSLDLEGFVFRGHANAAWPLLPSALRSEGAWQLPEPLRIVFARSFKMERGIQERFTPPGPCNNTNRGQIRREAELLHRFLVLADGAGLQLPGDSLSLRKEVEEWCLLEGDHQTKISTGAASWPPDALLGLAALAQHHGLPTRLLDWTRDAFAAAYFAATGEWTEKSEEGEICVWGVPLDVLSPVGGHQLLPVATPYAGNPNIHAQSGLFLVDRTFSLDLDADVDRTPWNLIVDDFNTIGFKMLLPVTERRSLLRVLRQLNVTAATLFPGYYGVVRGIREEIDLG